AMTGQAAGDPADAAVLHRILEPALREAATALRVGEPARDERDRLGVLLSAAAEDAQLALGDRARDPRLHRIVGAAASGAMALALDQDAVSAAQIRERLEEGLAEIAAGSWPPEDQDPAA